MKKSIKYTVYISTLSLFLAANRGYTAEETSFMPMDIVPQTEDMSSIPGDIFSEIIVYLDEKPYQLKRLSLVCKNWHKLRHARMRSIYISICNPNFHFDRFPIYVL